MSGSGTSQGGIRPRGSQRLAAAVALVALVLAVGAAVVGVAQHLGLAIVGLVCLIALGVAGWYAVSRTGFVRTVALVVVAAAVVGFVLIFIAASLDWWRVVGGLAAAAISIAAARVALRPPEPDETRPLVAEVAAAKPVLLMNPRSGGGKVERFHLVEECRKRGIEPVVLQPGDDLLQLAREAIDGGADVIGMAGGDGSQALVASLASRHDIPMVVVPAGTRNHFALDIGIDRLDVVGALEAYRRGVERRIDLAFVNDRVFVNNSSLGLYARIVQSPGYRDAKIQTSAAMLPEMLGPNSEQFDLRYTGPDGVEHSSAHLAMVSNNPYRIESLAGFGTREHLDGGVLGIVTMSIGSAAEWQQFLAMQATGRLGKFGGMIQWSAPEFEIRSREPVEIGIDGEALVMDPPLRFRSAPSALLLRIPPGAPGPPATKQRANLLTGSVVADLGRVAAGHQAVGLA